MGVAAVDRARSGRRDRRRPWNAPRPHVTHRNGHRPRVLSTKAGDLELGIPKLRKGSFFPSLLEPRRRIDQALYAVVMEAYVNGVSTRAVDDLVARDGRRHRHLEVRGVPDLRGARRAVAAFRSRTLGHVAFPYVYLDATYVNVRDDALGQVVSRAVVIATGITANGDREVLGVDVGDSEDETFWTRFLRSLRDRGLGGVRLVISDAHAGLKASIRKRFQGASWQRCRVHYARNLLAVIPKSHTEFVAAAFRSIFAHTTPTEIEPATARSPRPSPSGSPRPPAPRRRPQRRARLHRFPLEHWRKIWSNNPLERLNKEVKRRTNVVGIFPNDAAVIRLVGAVLADQHDEWAVARRYLSETSMALLAVCHTDDAQAGELQPAT